MHLLLRGVDRGMVDRRGVGVQWVRVWVRICGRGVAARRSWHGLIDGYRGWEGVFEAATELGLACPLRRGRDG